MKRTTLALPATLYDQLRGWLASPDELAGVLTARVVDDEGGTTLLGRALHSAPGGTYLDQRHDGLALRSTGWVPAVRGAKKDSAMALFVHSHPRGLARFSEHDDVVDDALASTFVEHTGSSLYGSLVLAGDTGASELVGRLRRADGSTAGIDTIRITGDRLQLRRPSDRAEQPQDAFDRQIRALGADGQATLAALRVGVVGAGGTGSAITEQLLRLGVRDLVIVDDDVVTPPTVTRGYGTGVRDAGRPKVEVLAELASRIGFGTQVTPVQGNARCKETICSLRHCDVVFCCVDGHAPRVALSRWAYWHLAPVIDVGVLVSSDAGVIDSIDARVTWLAPGAACLLCRGRISPSLAYAEHLDPEERRRLAAQGYAPELDEPQPSVVPYTTLIASWATTELLHRLFGFADPAPTEMLLRLHERAVRLNRLSPREGCFCNNPARWGGGTAEPYLDLLWAG